MDNVWVTFSVISGIIYWVTSWVVNGVNGIGGAPPPLSGVCPPNDDLATCLNAAKSTKHPDDD